MVAEIRRNQNPTLPVWNCGFFVFLMSFQALSSYCLTAGGVDKRSYLKGSGQSSWRFAPEEFFRPGPLPACYRESRTFGFLSAIGRRASLFAPSLRAGSVKGFGMVQGVDKCSYLNGSCQSSWRFAPEEFFRPGPLLACRREGLTSAAF